MHATESQAELPQPVADALDRGATVVTANQRAARTLRYAFDRRNRESGLKSWQPAAVLPWDAWTSGQWQSLLIAGEATELLMSSAQEHTLWRSILSADIEIAANLQSPDSLAELAADAWRLLVQHNGQGRLRGDWGNSETKAFQRWSSEFERRCRTQRLLPRAAVEDALRRAVETGGLRIATPIALVGFDERTPAQKNFLSAIKGAGTEVEELLIDVPRERGILVQTSDEIQEVSAAAWWTRGLLEQKPEMQIAVVVPSLEDRRGSIDRVFREVLAPELEDIQAPNYVSPYEFSLGVPLSETPMARVALDLARWVLAPLPVERVSALLVSPLFAMTEGERSVRAAFDALELRRARLLLPKISLLWLMSAIRRSKRRAELTPLLGALEAMARTVEGSTLNRRTHAAWADQVRELLRAARWGRGAGENSVEFQTRQKWESTLDELAMLDFDGLQVTFDQALPQLERLTQQTMFAPESHRAPVQVMGPLEAAGSSFDAVWFVGAGDLGWPIRSAPSPLLPWPLQ
ncbi:MAG TPA: hypothetical protein VK593_02720, partial [Edaphobacter sp.]|nr:hypothetical protein [Edaphobacter sp.]